MTIIMENNTQLLSDYADLYVVSERFQDGCELDYVPVAIFDNIDDANFYVDNSQKTLSVDECKGIINHKSPIEKLSYIYIVFNTLTKEIENLETKTTNTYDVVRDEDINDIHFWGNRLCIKKSCPNDFIFSDKNLVVDIANNILDDIEIRISGDYKITHFEPNREIITELLKEFDKYFIN